MGAMSGWIGMWLQLLHVEPIAFPLALAAAMLFALIDYRQRGPCTVGLPRQTKSWWRHHFGPDLAALFWGWDLGLGFTTMRVTSLYWVVALMVVVVGSPAAGATITGCYGAALVANWAWGQWRILQRGARPVAALALAPRLRVLASSILIAWSIGMLATLLGIGLLGAGGT